MRTIITIVYVKADYCFMSQLLSNILYQNFLFFHNCHATSKGHGLPPPPPSKKNSERALGTIGCARTIPATVADSKVVKRVAHTKSLGIVVDEYLSWDKHIDYISKKLKCNIGVIKRVCSVTPKESLVTLYRTLVEPYLRYGNSIWG